MNKILIILIFLTGINLGFSRENESNKWFFSKEKAIKGVAFTLHGLNSWPSTMDPIALFLNKKGIHVLRGALKGHQGSYEEMEHVSREIWFSETSALYQEALKKSKELKVPLYFVGYSIGALLFMDLISNSPEKIEVEKMILFSPAISIRAHLRFFSFIFYLPGSLKLPSRNLPEYRSDDYTPFAAYDALWKSYGRINWDKITPPKALIIMDSDDELISFGGVERIVKKIPEWELFEVDTSGSRNSGKYHHLTFNEKCYAIGVWENIEKKMENFLWPYPGTP
ncbi:MAG: alpha/beta hydrolase [Bacteriovoracales bacterium]